jgi:transposase
MPKVSRLEVIQTGARRRWTLEEKQRIVAESNSEPRAVSATARRHGLSPSHLFWWRRLAREGRLRADDATVGFAEAVVACETTAIRPAPAAGRIEIVFVNGLRVIVDQHVDATTLMRIMSIVERR